MARPSTGKVPPQALQHIRPRHRQIMYRLVAGEKQVDIALDLKITTTRLSIICNSPLFKKEYRKVGADGFVRKPFARETLLTTVKKLLKKKES